MNLGFNLWSSYGKTTITLACQKYFNYRNVCVIIIVICLNENT